jgi:hypothetical protein
MTPFEENQEYFDGFAWAVPLAFADALGACRFELGDMLYDTKRAYEGTWGQAIGHISYSIQVKYPSRATVPRGEKEKESVFTTNWRQRVVFDLTDHVKKRTHKIDTTHGRLYTLLWRGDHKCLDKKTDDPLVPLLAMDMVRKMKNREDMNIREAVPYFKRSIAQGIKQGAMFLMPYDRSWMLLRSKFVKVKIALEKIKPTIELASPEQAGLISKTGFAPTVKIVCFCIDEVPVSEVYEILKKALYNPAKDKKSKTEKFQIHRHGHLEPL